LRNEDKVIVVCIGASAGGLKPLVDALSIIPESNEDICYVVVQHLLRDKKSHMVDILGPKVSLDAKFIEDSEELKPGIIYLAPPGKVVGFEEGKFNLKELDEEGPNKSIDEFFSAASQEFGENVIGVVFSGSGTDSVEGCKSIYEQGGEVLVQNPTEAEFAGMPEGIIRSGFFTKTIHAEDLFSEVNYFCKQKKLVQNSDIFNEVVKRVSEFSDVIQSDTSVSLQNYKVPTVSRRITKRLSAHEYENVDEYLEVLRSKTNERKTLFSEIMVNVTEFFRDEDFFSLLKTRIAEVLESGVDDFRIWICGCSTGQEAISVAILLEEILERGAFGKIKYRILATDINPENIEFASRGEYSKLQIESIPEQYLQKYFEKKNGLYKLNEIIRNRLIYSVHDVVQSPPFSNIDLCICRNLLIYLTPTAQGRALTNLAFSVKVGGTFCLGPAETLGVFQRYFVEIDKKWKIFKKQVNAHVNLKGNFDLSYQAKKSDSLLQNVHEGGSQYVIDNNKYLSALESLFPNSIMIDDAHHIVSVFGEGSLLISNNIIGEMSTSIEKMFNQKTGVPLSSGMLHAKKTGEIVKFENVIVEDSDEKKVFDLEIKSLPLRSGKNFYVVSLDSFREDVEKYSIMDQVHSDALVSALKTETEHLRKELSAKEHENDKIRADLQSSSEELIASNEELQSTNEELNSVNEELYTLNSELQVRVDQVTTFNNDLTNLIESTEIGVIFLDSDLRLRSVTKQIEKDFYIRETDQSRSVFELDFGRYLTPFKKKLETDSYFSRNFEILSKDQKYFRCQIKPYFDSVRHPKGFVVTLFNVDDEKRKEVFLEETQTDGKIGGWIYSVETASLVCSKQVYRLYGLPEEHPIELDSILSNFLGDTREEARDLINRAVRGTPFERSLKFVSGSGQQLWVRFTGKPIFDADGKVVKVRGSIQDITQIKLLEERTSHALAAAKTGIWDWNLEAGELFWDEVMCDIYGITEAPKNLNFETWLGFIHKEDKKKFDTTIKYSIDERVNLEFRCRIVTPNGEAKTVYFSAKVITDKLGRTVRMLGANLDVSQIAKQEVELRRQYRISAQSAKLAQLGELAAGLGHEINNPLAIALGNVELLTNLLEDKNEGLLSEDESLILGKINIALDRISKLVRGLRTFSRDFGDGLTQFNVKAAIIETIELMDVLRIKEKVKVDFELAENLFVFGSRSKFNQVVTNVIVNALDALVEVPNARITISSLVKGDRIFVSIKDNGPGVPLEIREKIYNHFFTTKSPTKGTGIGLSLSRNLIEQMEGKFYLNENVESGAEFVIELPISPVEIALDENSLPVVNKKAKKELQGMKILLIDDDIDDLEMIKKEFMDLGVKVTETTDSSYALELAQKNSYDGVFCDLNMKPMTGVEFFDELGKSSQYKTDSFFIISGGMPTHQLAEVNNSCKEIVVKPIKRKRLYEILKALPKNT
jgi:two-component system CheB/CheR fusion protein